MLGDIAWTVLGLIGAFWAICAGFVAVLMIRALRRDPRVVVDDPWDGHTGTTMAPTGSPRVPRPRRAA